MKVGTAILMLAAGLGACSKGVGTLVTTNQSNTNASTAISPGNQAGALNSPATGAPGASTVALTANPQAGLFLTQLVTQLGSTSLLNAISNDTDTAALSLADTNDANVAQAQKSEISAFINYFFSNPDMVISEKTCSHITDHMNVRISHAKDWLSYIDGRLACIDKAAPSVGVCWGAATDTTHPYGVWKQLQSILTAVVAQVQNNETAVKDLCTTYFTQNPTATINKVDFLAAVTAIAVSAGTTLAAGVGTDSTAVDASSTLSSLVSNADLVQNTQALVQQAWDLHRQLISGLKATAKICTSKLPPEERKPFAECWATATVLSTTTSTESVTP